MAGRRREMLPGERLNLPFRHIEQVFETAGQMRPGVIHTADAEHQRDRLTAGILLPAELKFRPGTRRHIAVSGGVHGNGAEQSFPPGFAFGDHAAHSAVLTDGIADEGVELQPHAGFGQHIEQHFFQQLVADLVTARPLCGAENPRRFTMNPVHHLVEQRGVASIGEV